VAFASTRALSSMLYGISPTDVGTFTTGFVSMMFVALAATYVPASYPLRLEAGGLLCRCLFCGSGHPVGRRNGRFAFPNAT